MRRSLAMVAPDLTERRMVAELMDSPTLDSSAHFGALDALSRVNRVSLTVGRVWKEVVRLARTGVSPVRVLDVACGGGDLLAGVAGRAERAGISVACHGCDLSARALDRARSRGGDRLGIDFTRMDVTREPLPGGYHVVGSTLFLHHLDRADAVSLLASMASASERVLLVQDLRRTRLGYLFARVGLGVLTRSEVARRDGRTSVAAAWTVPEVEAMCREAGLDAVVRPCWPQRFAVRWERR